MTTPQIISHRGASYLAAENTLVAFRKALEIGADAMFQATMLDGVYDKDAA